MKQIVLAVVALVLGVGYIAWSSRDPVPEPTKSRISESLPDEKAPASSVRSRESWPGQFENGAEPGRATPLPATARPSHPAGSPERADEFARRKSQLLAEANALIGQRRHAEAARLLQPWLTEQDNDVFALWSEASNGRKAADRQAQIDQLQARVDALPAGAYRQRSALYGQMAQLDRSNPIYQDEALRYSLLADAELAKQ